MTLQDILTIKHERIFGAEATTRITCSGVSTDSRTTKPGDLFVAIRGTQFNGHDFLSRAVECGARLLIVDKNYSQANEHLIASLLAPTVVVEDTVHALGQLALHYRHKFKIPILAIAGSNGKTTTKEMIARVLKTKFRVLSTEGNLNNYIGVPLTLFRLEKKHTMAVIEIGTNHFGEIAYLCGILQPTHALITNIAGEHLEFFGDLDGVAHAERELFDWLQLNRQKDGMVFLNKDDPFLRNKKPKAKKVFTYGFEPLMVDVRGSKVRVNEHAFPSFQVKPRNRSPFGISLQVPGGHNAANALAAAAVGLAFRIPTAKIQHALRSFRSIGKRSELLDLHGVKIINDTYNSNPDSARAAIEALRSMRTDGKRIAVLADMLELGKDAPRLHEEMGAFAGKTGVDYLLTYGPLSRHTHNAATTFFRSHYEQKNILAEFLAELVAPGDVVLIKGSRAMKMEDVVTFLTERLSSPKRDDGRAA